MRPPKTVSQNPRVYYEDSHRAQSTYHSNLRSLRSVPTLCSRALVCLVVTMFYRSMPVTLVASLIEPKSHEPHEPSQRRVHNFESLTRMPFNDPIDLTPHEIMLIECPRCLDLPRVNVLWWNSSGTGLAQDGFEAVCPTCEKTFTKETMGVRRLCDELALRRSGTPIAFS
jgi:hypothetical protein